MATDSSRSGTPGQQAARAAARLSKVVEVALKDTELSLTQYRLLMYLAEGSAPAASLAERLIVSRPSVTTLVDVLVERGLVDRRHDESDRRRVNHVLTEQGRAVLTSGDEAVTAALTGLAERLGGVDSQQILIGLDLLHDALDDAMAERENDRTQTEVPA